MERANLYLGLDLGSHLGYAVAEGEVIKKTGWVNLRAGEELIGDRWQNFWNFLVEYGDGVSEIFHEKVMAHGQWAVSLATYFKLEGFLELYTRAARIPRTSIHHTRLKSQFSKGLVEGRAGKMDICAICHDMGWKGGEPGTTRDHDEADAIAALIVGGRYRGLEIKFPTTP